MKTVFEIAHAVQNGTLTAREAVFEALCKNMPYTARRVRISSPFSYSRSPLFKSFSVFELKITVVIFIPRKLVTGLKER